MKTPILVLLISILLLGCTSGENKAAGLLETARFEEKQSNGEHARKLYNEIIQKHPDSQAAKAAAARLDELKQLKQ